MLPTGKQSVLFLRQRRTNPVHGHASIRELRSARGPDPSRPDDSPMTPSRTRPCIRRPRISYIQGLHSKVPAGRTRVSIYGIAPDPRSSPPCYLVSIRSAGGATQTSRILVRRQRAPDPGVLFMIQSGDDVSLRITFALSPKRQRRPHELVVKSQARR